MSVGPTGGYAGAMQSMSQATQDLMTFNSFKTQLQSMQTANQMQNDTESANIANAGKGLNSYVTMQDNLFSQQQRFAEKATQKS